MKAIFYFLSLSVFISACQFHRVSGAVNQKRPNILLIMSDDQGWFDVGFNGNKEIKTPHSDFLASQGVILDRFYSASAVCSPTRASVMTGRNPERIAVPHANMGHLDKAEITLAEVLKKEGYATGHFGKWHLGTFTTTEKDANRGGNPKERIHFTIPSEHGYDDYFSTESKVPTYNPMQQPVTFQKNESLQMGWNSRSDKSETTYFGTAYWETGNKKVTENLEGDDSKLIMDHLLHFIDKSKENRKPFFSTVWFHTPHLPVVTNQKYRSLYPNKTQYEQNYLGAITALDEQLGRLWAYLEKIGEAENTIIFYCSDNGPEEKTPGSAGVFRADKRDLYEGGVRVPAFVVWKGKLKGGKKIDAPMVTSDYFPTVLNALNLPLPANRAYDGKNIWNLINENDAKRNQPIGFILSNKHSWVTDQYKLISVDNGKTYELYDLIKDKSEQHNIISSEPDIAAKMKQELDVWLKDIRAERKKIEASWKTE